MRNKKKDQKQNSEKHQMRKKKINMRIFIKNSKFLLEN